MNKIVLKYNPFGLIIDQTKLCNLRCYFCHKTLNSQDRNELQERNHTLPFETYSRIIDEASSVESIFWLSLCGPMGEPLLIPDIVDRLNYARSKKHFRVIVINTNGLALDRHDPEKLLGSLTDLQFSVDSIRETTYNKIHCGGNLARLIENIRYICTVKRKLGTGASINVRFTENEYNIGEWEEFREYFEGIADTVFRVKVHSFMGVMSGYITELGATICNQPFLHVNFNYRGELTTCCLNWKCEPAFGSIHTSSLKELWEGSSVEEWRENRLRLTCRDCGGLGGFQQRVDYTPTEQELELAAAIRTKGERRYYEGASKKTLITRTDKLLHSIKRAFWVGGDNLL